LDVLKLGGRGGAQLVGGTTFSLELVLLGRERIFADEVAVEQLDQLLLLGSVRSVPPLKRGRHSSDSQPDTRATCGVLMN
jgi:hypothetical protein